MAWETYKPENRARTKQPRAQIRVAGKLNTLLINSPLAKSWGSTLSPRALFCATTRSEM